VAALDHLDGAVHRLRRLDRLPLGPVRGCGAPGGRRYRGDRRGGGALMSVTTMWTGLGVFAVLLAYLGSHANRRTTQTMEDFVLGSRKLDKLPAFFTVTATLFSAFSYFGITGQFYTNGIGAWIQVATTAAVGPIIYFAGTRIWLVARRYRLTNVTEYLSDRYGSRCAGPVAGAIGLLALAPYMGDQVHGS